MIIASFHFLSPSIATALRLLRLNKSKVEGFGIKHFEVMSCMTLGAPILSPTRLQWRKLAIFAVWKSESALENFLQNHPLGESLNDGWHVRLEFLRQWGSYPELGDFPPPAEASAPNEPVVSITLAKLKLPELLRFIHWGRPVEIQVRDHPAVTLASAAFFPFRTFCTFSIWQTESAMTAMVHGRESPDLPSMRHANAMGEQRRRSFHHHFITLRFRPLSEHGSWNGKTKWLPSPPCSLQDESTVTVKASIE